MFALIFAGTLSFWQLIGMGFGFASWFFGTPALDSARAAAGLVVSTIMIGGFFLQMWADWNAYEQS